MEDLYCYSVRNVLRQIQTAPRELGFYTLRFYSKGNRISKEKTDVIVNYYYFPSGGTIRDSSMNILFYEPKLDMYHKLNQSHHDEDNASSVSDETGS